MAATQGFEDFVSARGQALQRFGYLLTSDWALAEDLVQTAFARAYPRWSRIESDAPEAYVRKVMVNTWSSWWRRRWRGEVPAARIPDLQTSDPYQEIDRRQAIGTALAGLPHLLGISVGTVKSQASKALAKLRADGALDGYRSSLTGGA